MMLIATLDSAPFATPAAAAPRGCGTVSGGSPAGGISATFVDACELELREVELARSRITSRATVDSSELPSSTSFSWPSDEVADDGASPMTLADAIRPYESSTWIT